MLSKTQLETISQRQKLTMSLTIVILMVTSTMLVLVQDLSSEEITPTYVFRAVSYTHLPLPTILLV